MSKARPIIQSIALFISLVGVLAACSIRIDPTRIRVIVYVRVCPPSSSDCYNLRVPSVDIAAVPIAEKTGIAMTGTTNEAGEITLTVEPGRYTVTAQSFALEGGSVLLEVSAASGKTTDVKLEGKLVKINQ